MIALVVAEHDNQRLSDATARAVSAALILTSDVHVLVAGEYCAAVADLAAELSGVTKVLLAEDALYAHALAEPMAELVIACAANYDAILAAATANGKNIL